MQNSIGETVVASDNKFFVGLCARLRYVVQGFAQVRAATVANNSNRRISVCVCLICFYLAQAGGWVGSTEAQGFVWKQFAPARPSIKYPQIVLHAVSP